MLRGAIAAAVTPLTADGSELDEGAIGPLARFLAEHGIDGVLACGTTGEGVLLTVDERRRVAERFLEARPDVFQVAVHAGAQTTADTVSLATHAKEIGADAVAVIAPPYFPLDGPALLAHLRSAAEACGPLPFHAALKEILVARGVPAGPAVRPPLRGLTSDEREVALDAARRVGAI